MSEQEPQQPTQPEVTQPVVEPAVDAGSPPDATIPASSSTPPEGDESTVGTGTSIALGCIAGTVILIVLGLIVVGIIALVG